MNEKAEFLRRHFFARTDVVAVLAPWGAPSPATTQSLDDLLTSHVTGSEATALIHTRKSLDARSEKWRVGSYCSDKDGNTSWCCIDIDGSGGAHHHPVADADGAVRQIAEHCVGLGVPHLLERSGGGRGWHVWIFFAEKVPVSQARRFGFALIPPGILLADGKPVDVERSRGIEVFPKTQAKSKVGTMVWLPWWYGAKPGGNQFVDATGTEYVPQEVVHLTAAKALDLAATVKETKEEKREKKREQKETQKRNASTFDGWRTEVLAALDLNKVYGEWLTGKIGGAGWLECRDPFSTTGDKTPSAGVADGTGIAERGSFHNFHDDKTVSVFDFLMQHQSLTFRQAAELLAGWTGIQLPHWTPEAPAGGRPNVFVGGRQLNDVIKDGWEAIKKHNNPPIFFVKDGLMVRMISTEFGRTLDTVKPSMMFGQLIRAARWVTEKKEILIDVTPPKDVAQDMLDFPDTSSTPEIDAIVQCPIYDSNGKLVMGHGYNQESRLWLDLKDEFTVINKPTQADVIDAMKWILEALHDFPFDDDGDRAHAIAMMICPFVRRMIKGCTPLHLIEAPGPGAGKGLLADLCSLILTGRPVPVSTMSENPEETRKRITSILIESSPTIMLDNVSSEISSAEICSAVTTPVWKDRVLGVNRMITLANQATWIVTSNNPSLSKEIARRCIRIRIDPRMTEPWKRTKFKHPKLREWTLRNRPFLVSSIICLVQWWLSNGAPHSKKTLGTFESWAGILGGILETCGIPGFLSNLDKLYANSDYQTQQWKDFAASWWELKGGAPVAIADIMEFVENENLIESEVYATHQKKRIQQLAQALRNQRGVRIADTFGIESYEDKKTHRVIYKMVRYEMSDSEAQSEEEPDGAVRVDES